ncbi:uncharacterized protein LTR77_010929 [Saxophila tyrrhenica]|uniref:Exonuclease domain-containing protein n=1 Tax=Saxophila tyrrhenica TaxID=1690608 RepID=A0AAV9NWN0_9PEZI|nr:hypothetical protein LTR77_010929 [Saxophila tyrrhenica]
MYSGKGKAPDRSGREAGNSQRGNFARYGRGGLNNQGSQNHFATAGQGKPTTAGPFGTFSGGSEGQTSGRGRGGGFNNQGSQNHSVAAGQGQPYTTGQSDTLSGPSTGQFNGRGRGGGFHGGSPSSRSRAEQLTVNLGALTPGAAVAIDCEGVVLHAYQGSAKKGCGRFSVVAEDGTIIYDTFCYYPREAEGRPPLQRCNLGVKYKDIIPSRGAQPIAEVVLVATQIFNRAGVIVGHAIKNELDMLSDVDWSGYVLRDTQVEYGGGLENAAKYNLGQHDLQTNGHSSVEDAKATMKLYLLRRSNMDATQTDRGRKKDLTVAAEPIMPTVPITTTTPVVPSGAFDTLSISTASKDREPEQVASLSSTTRATANSQGLAVVGTARPPTEPPKKTWASVVASGKAVSKESRRMW